MSLEFLKYAQNLKNVYRQGWIDKLGISQPESVSDHSYMMALMGMVFSDILELNSEKILKMILIHDIAESKIGDITPEMMSQEKKKSMENLAFHEIVKFLPEKIKTQYLELWKEFESDSSLESKFVHQIDKLEMALQAKIYEKSIKDSKKINIFLESARNSIIEPELKEILSKIEELN